MKFLLKAAGNDFDGMEQTLDAVLSAFNTADLAFGPLVADTELRARKNEDAVARLEAMQGEFNELRDSFIRKDDELRSALNKLQREEEKDVRINSLTTELERARIEADTLRTEVAMMRNSTSWRVSKPVRMAGKLFGKE